VDCLKTWVVFKKIDDKGYIVGGNENKTPSGRIISIMEFD